MVERFNTLGKRVIEGTELSLPQHISQVQMNPHPVGVHWIHIQYTPVGGYVYNFNSELCFFLSALSTL